MVHDELVDLWDQFHPVDSDDDAEFYEAGDWPDLEEVPQIPTIDLLPDNVDYSSRSPGDFVLSGPMGTGRGTGRYFKTAREALVWAVNKYGKNRVKPLEGEGGEFRWAILVRAV